MRIKTFSLKLLVLALPFRFEWEFGNESCIYRLISKCVGLKTWFFAQTCRRKTEKDIFHSEAHASCMGRHASRGSANFSHLGHSAAHLGRASNTWQCIFAFFLVFLSVFFFEYCLGTWNRISPLCNVFRVLLNHHSLSSHVLFFF